MLNPFFEHYGILGSVWQARPILDGAAFVFSTGDHYFAPARFQAFLADQPAANVLPVIREIRRAGAASLHQITGALNARGITTARGGDWHASSVRNVPERGLARGGRYFHPFSISALRPGSFQ